MTKYYIAALKGIMAGTVSAVLLQQMVKSTTFGGPLSVSVESRNVLTGTHRFVSRHFQN